MMYCKIESVLNCWIELFLVYQLTCDFPSDAATVSEITGGGGAKSFAGFEPGDDNPDVFDIFGGGGACISSTEIRIQIWGFAWNSQKRREYYRVQCWLCASPSSMKPTIAVGRRRHQILGFDVFSFPLSLSVVSLVSFVFLTPFRRFTSLFLLIALMFFPCWAHFQYVIQLIHSYLHEPHINYGRLTRTVYVIDAIGTQLERKRALRIMGSVVQRKENKIKLYAF